MEEDPRRSAVRSLVSFSMRELTLAPCVQPPSPSRQLILPYLQLDIKYFDLVLVYRDAVRGYASPATCSHILTITYVIPICVPTHAPYIFICVPRLMIK